MVPHEEFLRLCAAATAGELTADEQTRIEAHLVWCAECRRAMAEYEAASRQAGAALASEFDQKETGPDGQWSVEEAEKRLFQRLETEKEAPKVSRHIGELAKPGRRFSYRPSQVRWREVWMSLAAVVILSLALAITAYRSGLKRGTDDARTHSEPTTEPGSSLEAQASDAGYERAMLEATLAANARVIDDLRRQLSEQTQVVAALKSINSAGGSVPENGQEAESTRKEELLGAQTKLAELQKSVNDATAQRDENARQAAVLEAKVNELTQLLQEREQSLNQKDAEVAKGQELLEHDRDIRELMGARDLYIADIRDVSGTGTDKTYGRVFYTKGKSLIFYAFDLDAQPGLRKARSFQAWGRRGPDKQQARSLGIFYEDNASKKRWVLKADDPKSLEDIDAVFVTVEPNGGSQHPSGKPLLFAYLRVNANHP